MTLRWGKWIFFNLLFLFFLSEKDMFVNFSSNLAKE